MTITARTVRAMEVANKLLNVVNAYKIAVGLQPTPFNEQRFAGIAQGVIDTWNNPERTPADNHTAWMERMIADGWRWGEELSEEDKTHPALVDWNFVPELYKVNDALFLAIVKANNPDKD